MVPEGFKWNPRGPEVATEPQPTEPEKTETEKEPVATEGKDQSKINEEQPSDLVDAYTEVTGSPQELPQEELGDKVDNKQDVVEQPIEPIAAGNNKQEDAAKKAVVITKTRC